MNFLGFKQYPAMAFTERLQRKVVTKLNLQKQQLEQLILALPGAEFDTSLLKLLGSGGSCY